MKQLLLSVIFSIIWTMNAYGQNTVGTLIYDQELSFEGLNVLYPHNQPNVYLINNCGDVVHKWQDEEDFRPGNTAYILDNGNLVKAKRLRTSAVNDPIWAGGGGESVDIRTWENELLYSFTLNTEQERIHHDIAITEDETVLMIAWELKSREESIAAGRDTALLPNDKLWPDFILEWDPIRDSIIWEWHVWDHLVQDLDSSKMNFGIVSDHPELIDINYDEHDGHQDWLHANSIDYNPVLDQIVLSVPYFNEFWIIDHSTTTEEAASHSGGKSDKGGDILYRWGNPAAYKNGSIDDKKLFFQHSVKWVDAKANASDDDFGSICLYNNRVSDSHSTLNIINTLSSDPEIGYELMDGTYLPFDFHVNVVHPDTLEIASSNSLSSVQVLPNGNILALAGRWGYAYEITSNSEVVWEYRVPINGGMPIEQGSELGINNNITFRIQRYPIDFQGFENRNLDSGPRLELNPSSEICDVISATEDVITESDLFSIKENPVVGHLRIEASGNEHLEIIDLSGTVLHRFDIDRGDNIEDVSKLPDGLFIIRSQTGQTQKFIKI